MPLSTVSAIEFPGTLRDASDPRKALSALGGEEAVRATLTLPTGAPPLTLSLRPHAASPSNILSDPPYAPTNLFLLSFTTDQSSSASTARLVAHVTALVRFRALADFQYHVPRPLTLHPPDAAAAVFDALSSYPHPSPNHDDLLPILRPRRFARAQVEYGQTDYWFRQLPFASANPAHIAHRLVPGRPLGDDRRSDTNRLALLHHRVRIDVPRVPDAPSEHGVIPVQRRRETFAQLRDLLVRLFQIRPIWVRRALFEGIPLYLRRNFTRAIAMVAYSFQGPGPFYQAWIRYGYDPRKDPSARKYQTVEIRITNPVILAASREQDREKDTSDIICHGEKADDPDKPDKPENPENPENPDDKDGMDDDTTAGISAAKYPPPFRMPPAFILSDIPTKKNSFIQVCDIQLDAVGKVCSDEEARVEFDAKYGFFSEDGMNRITKAVKETLLEIATKRLSDMQATETGDGGYDAIKKNASRRRRLFLKDVVKSHDGVVPKGGLKLYAGLRRSGDEEGGDVANTDERGNMDGGGMSIERPMGALDFDEEAVSQVADLAEGSEDVLEDENADQEDADGDDEEDDEDVEGEGDEEGGEHEEERGEETEKMEVDDTEAVKQRVPDLSGVEEFEILGEDGEDDEDDEDDDS